jgi:hypothetical protein
VYGCLFTSSQGEVDVYIPEFNKYSMFDNFQASVGLVDCCPTLHLVQAVEPDSLEKVPEGHGWQVLLSVTLEKVPAGHELHADGMSKERYCPGEHCCC